jgi:hypothetical protein
VVTLFSGRAAKLCGSKIASTRTLAHHEAAASAIRGEADMRYASGEEIRKGDKVLFHDQAGEIEFIAEELSGDDEADWFVREHGPGLMISGFDHVYISASDPVELEDLVFVSRCGIAS